NKYYVRPPEFWTVSEAQDAFFDEYFTTVPPGEAEWALKDDLPLLGAMRDYDLRDWISSQEWTVHQYRTALAQVDQWLKDNPDKLFGTPEEWEQARAINDFYWDRINSLFPRYTTLIDQYMDLGDDRQAKRRFREENPELVAFWDWREQFAATHQLWAKYYRPEDYEGAAAGGQAAAAGAGGGGPYYGGRRYYGGGGGGGRGRRSVSIRNWDQFMMQANPKAIRQLFAAWRGAEGDTSALKALHAEIGWGSLSDWMTWLLQLYQRQFSGTKYPPGVQYAHWLPGVR
ncbi:MAG: hypothetical protein PVF54_10965, partial [Anaerolineae bacterium]